MTQTVGTHLLMKLKYRDLLKIAKKENITVKGKKRDVVRDISEGLSPEKVREYFAKASGVTVQVLEHELVPTHEVLPEKDAEEFLRRLHASQIKLPKILDTDPAVLAIQAKPGDIIRIKRKSPTAGWSYYYRTVVKHVTE